MIHIFSSGTLEEKYKFSFNLIDINKSNFIDFDHFNIFITKCKIVSSNLRNQPKTNNSNICSGERVQKDVVYLIYKLIDTLNKGHFSQNE